MSSRTMQHGNLRMSLPEGWSDATQIVAVGPMEKGFRSSLAVSSEPAAPREGLGQHAARVLPMLRKVTEQFELVAEGPATFGTQNGFLREYRHVARGVKLSQLQFYVLSGGLVHTFTYTQLAERMTVSRATAERLFASVFLGDAPVATPMSPRIRPKGVHFRFLRSIAA
ncbi:hypothetical protein SAMN05444354_12873 [Stigmatella aurantiaca]|uniref:Uncharacterized protein n=1 Tax=Stigmatella aurantiaca TaxID=41 RepID=A0A1H8D5W8_STIAU|nr:DUF1795 domain-containing protein [Stigmatella aurantiaca]SEN02018.1 hypothetical protein SAMN05444354_12873 [Stigmatella aurantiaca]